jgi:hypothetical protein
VDEGFMRSDKGVDIDTKRHGWLVVKEDGWKTVRLESGL